MPPEIPIYEETWFVPTLLGGLLFFQVLLLFAVMALAGKVSRLARMIATRDAGPVAGPELVQRKEENSEQKQQFAKFLEEDPARKELPKKEQFAEFRKWRDEKGLNWKSAGEG